MAQTEGLIARRVKRARGRLPTPRAVALAWAVASVPALPAWPALAATAGDGLVGSYAETVAASASALERQRTPAAIALARAAVAADAGPAAGHWALGRALLQAGDLPAATQALEEAWRRAPHERGLCAELGSAYDVQQAYARAISVYRTCLAHDPSATELRHELGLSLMLAGEADAAAAELGALAAAAPSAAQVRLDWGQALVKAHRYAEAQAALAPLCRGRDAPPLDCRALAWADAGLGEPAAALRLLDQLLAAHPQAAQLWLMRARLHVAAGTWTAAAADYRRAQQLAPEDVAAPLGLAGVAVAMGDWATAERAVVRAEALEQSPRVAFRRAQVDLQRGVKGAYARLQELAAGALDVDEVWRALLAAARAQGDAAGAARAQRRLAGRAN